MMRNRLDLAAECKHAAERCTEAALLLHRMAQGDGAAAESLDALCRRVPYEGAVFMVAVDDLIAAFEDDED